MMKRFLCVALVAACFCPYATCAGLFDADEFYLDNGLRGVVVRNTKAPIVKMMLWYKVGSIDEAPGKGGLAHLLEHLMFRGTKNVPGSNFNGIVERNGGESNAFTTHDFTGYYEFVDISRLEAMMALEADRMENLDISDEAFAGERDIVAHERRQRVTNNPAAVFAENLNRVLWGNHGYGRPVSGTEEEIAGLDRQDAENFYHRYYRPDNAVIVFSGDIDAVTAKHLTEKYFGRIKKHDAPVAENAISGEYDGVDAELRMSMPNVTTSRVIRRYVVPTLKQNAKAAYALDLFVSFLDGGDNSYLNRNLVLTGKVVSAGADYQASSRLRGVFSVAAVPLPEQSAEETKYLLVKALSDALAEITEEDVAKEKAKISANLVYIRDNPEDAAYLVGEAAALGLSLQDIENYEENMQAVSLSDIKSAVRTMLDESAHVTGILLPVGISEKEKSR